MPKDKHRNADNNSEKWGLQHVTVSPWDGQFPMENATHFLLPINSLLLHGDHHSPLYSMK